MEKQRLHLVGWLVVAILAVLVPPASAASVPPDLASAAEAALIDWQDAYTYTVHSVSVDGDALTVCLDVPLDVLAAEGWLGVEQVTDSVRRALTTLEWRILSVQALDTTERVCRPLSDYIPKRVAGQTPASELDELAGVPLPVPGLSGAPVTASSAVSYPASLAGKTVYLSAGHGWYWNGSAWRTQRPVYQGFIEDHNNAEVVTQYLIPYLENAGATVVYTRERDRNPVRVIADNDAGPPTFEVIGSWPTGISEYGGYDGGTYQYAMTDPTGALSAEATWTMSVPTQGEYAVYAWVYPGPNRVRDAHYTVHHAAGATEILVDQSVDPLTWRYLGTFAFYSGTATVTLDNRTLYPAACLPSPVCAIIADAIRLGTGAFNSLDGIPLPAPSTPSGSPVSPPPYAPNRPWWESGSFYWSQWVGLDPLDTSLVEYLNDVVVRPIHARWYERLGDANGVFVSWHTNGYNGTARGTESYIHFHTASSPRTEGSVELQAAVHDELIRDIRAGWDPGWIDRGMKQSDLGELRVLYDEDYSDASIPGVLLEIAFHDNLEDANALKDPRFERLAARAVYQGIVRYFEGRDGGNLVYAPEPPTHLRVQNAGSGQLLVSWSPPAVDGIGGEAATGYRVATSPDGFAWQQVATTTGVSAVLSGLAPGQTIYVRVTATNDGGESFPTEVMGARVGEARLLLVNGFDKLDRFGLVREVDPVEGENLRMWLEQMNSFDYVVHHGQAIPAGYAWDSASNEAVQSGAVPLLAYDIVDWILGEESSVVDGSFNAAERNLLTSYLAIGRSLLVSGSEYAWHLEALGADPDFLHMQLHTDYVADDAGTYTVRPVAGGAFDGLGDLHFDAPGEYDADWPDVLAPTPGAQVALTYVNAATPGGAAIQYAQGCQRLLVLGFPFETLRSSERAPVMAAAMAYLDACHIDTEIAYPADGSFINAAPTLQGTTTGDVARVDLRLRRLSDGYYWAGSAWQALPVWFAAQGTELWFYALPVPMAWMEGQYSLTACAAVGAISDESPAEASFMLDRIAPTLPPTVITPTATALLQGPLISLVWEPVAQDSGSPLLYGVELDSSGLVTRFATSPGTVGLGNGVHTWRIRTEDAAGNVSGWSAVHTFEVYGVKQAFLPLVMRQR